MNFNRASLAKHRQHQGKIEIKSKFGPLTSREDLSIAYTPGVAAVSTYVSEHPEKASIYTIKGNTIAIVSDGSAVLGLGNIGPLGALPVMEGKALLFKQFAGVDAYPIVLATQDTEEIIKVVKAIAPTFGGINLEDISAPRCFEIEERLVNELDIPVMHDDQHGTAIVVLAALINSLKLVKKNAKDIRVVISGAGAAGTAIAKLLYLYGVRNLIMVDSKGTISKDRPDLNKDKQQLLTFTNQTNLSGTLARAVVGADVFVGVSAPGIVTPKMISTMNTKSIVFAMANPIPEIMPDEAKKGGAYIVGTGRSDFPNQINNVLAFPGVFRGALDNHVSKITDHMKLAAAQAIAGCVSKTELGPEKILPTVFDKKVVTRVAKVIRE